MPQASAVPVILAMAPRPVGAGDRAGRLRVAGAGYRDAGKRKRRAAFAGVQASVCAGTRHPELNRPELNRPELNRPELNHPELNHPELSHLTFEEPRVNT